MTRYRAPGRRSRLFRAALPFIDALRPRVWELLSERYGHLASDIVHLHVCFTTRSDVRRAYRLARRIDYAGPVLTQAHKVCDLCRIFVGDQRRCPECRKTRYLGWCPGTRGGCPRCVLAEGNDISTRQIDRELRSLFQDLEASP